MRRQLVATTALIALAALVVLGVPLGIVESRRARSEELAKLEREADAIAGAIDDRVEAGSLPSPASLARLSPPDRRVTAVAGRHVVRAGRRPSGKVLVARSGGNLGVRVRVVGPAAGVSHRQRDVWLLVIGLGLAGTAAATGLAMLQARRIVRPLHRLTATSALLGDGDFSARAGRLDVPEFDRVAVALDGAAAQIAQLVARQREFATNVSHQLRSPLTALRLRVEELVHADDRAQRRAEVEAALRTADRLEATIDELLALARAGAVGTPRDVDLGDLAREHAARWHDLFASAGRRLVLEAEGPVPARVVPGGVAQALDVLLDNSLRHGSGAVTLAAGAVDGRGVLSVVDEGPGIPAGDERRIFAPHVSTAGSTGIGLALARALVEADGGQLVLAQRTPARFEIRVPRRRPRAP